MDSSPKTEYERRLAERSAALAREERRFRLVSHFRLAVAAVFVVLAVLAFRRDLSGWWVLLPVAVFIILVRWHERIARARDCCERAVALYRRGLARIEDRWTGDGERGERFRDPRHPYAADLDLFGDASLFQLLSTARTPMGESKLAQWLLAPADPAEIARRQQAVAELRHALDLREQAGTDGLVARAAIDVERAADWSELPPVLKSAGLCWLAVLITATSMGTAVAWAATGDMLPFVAAFLIGVALLYRLHSRVDEIASTVEAVTRDLQLITALLARLEREEFRSPLLREIRDTFGHGGLRASHAIERLMRLSELAEHRHNLFVQALDPVLQYSVQVAYAIEGWRKRHGAQVRGWFDALAQFEALAALAAYSYEHPQDSFPEIVEGAQFDGEGLGHPLIPDARCVRNSVRLGNPARVLLVSGSNMSGKSTLLRVVGVNAVLALAGAPVRARRLRLGGLQAGACMRVTDSLQQGTSHFFAEITRLRALVDLAAAGRPMLFLVDELLHGTNSSDRNAGAEGLIRGLLQRGALGLVTTHDLTLTALAGEFGDAVRNVHFQDRIENGKISFDYRLRDGVVTHSNGLELMRAIGLLP